MTSAQNNRAQHEDCENIKKNHGAREEETKKSAIQPKIDWPTTEMPTGQQNRKLLIYRTIRHRTHTPEYSEQIWNSW